jgi:hypothetical protein
VKSSSGLFCYSSSISCSSSSSAFSSSSSSNSSFSSSSSSSSASSSASSSNSSSFSSSNSSFSASSSSSASSSASASCYCSYSYFSLGRAGRNPAYRTSAFEAVCTLTPIFSSPVHLQKRSTPDGLRDLYKRKEELWARNGRSNLARQSDFHVITGFFNMPQSCDMGQTALLPLRRKACCGFFRLKNLTALAGIEPAILGTRGQHANH